MRHSYLHRGIHMVIDEGLSWYVVLELLSSRQWKLLPLKSKQATSDSSLELRNQSSCLTLKNFCFEKKENNKHLSLNQIQIQNRWKFFWIIEVGTTEGGCSSKPFDIIWRSIISVPPLFLLSGVPLHLVLDDYSGLLLELKASDDTKAWVMVRFDLKASACSNTMLIPC